MTNILKSLVMPIFDFSRVKTVVSYSIATGFGAGFSRYIPGTVGTIWAWITFLILDYILTDVFLIFTILSTFIIGILVSNFVEEDLKKKDASEIVIDEIVAFWVVLFFLPRGDDLLVLSHGPGNDFPLIQIQAFFLFRFFDIFKPWPTNWVDKKVHGGLGVMLDDIVAAFQTLLILSVLHRLELT